MNDFLNILWKAVSTPNKTTINIISIPLLILVEVPLTFQIICNILQINYTRKQKNIFITILATSALISKYLIKAPYNIILNYGTLFIILYYVLKTEFIKSAVGTLLPGLIFGITETLEAKIYLYVLKISLEQAEKIAIYRIPLILIIYATVSIICFLIKSSNRKLYIIETFDKRTKIAITIAILFGFVCIFLQGIIGVKYIDKISVEFAICSFIGLVIYITLSIYVLECVSKLTTTKRKLEIVENYNKTLHILYDSVRGFKHDFDNIVTTIGGYINTEDINGLKKYYKQLENDCTKINNMYLLNPDIVNNPGIYSLLTTKYNEAEKEGIKVNLTFLLDLNNLHMKIYEFARILGILLDNAKEASVESDEKIINIEFRDETRNKRNLIRIENTYKNKNVNLDKIFEKGVSGKENHTGIGLWEIRKILNKNNNVNLYTSKTNKMFIQQLEIYY